MRFALMLYRPGGSTWYSQHLGAAQCRLRDSPLPVVRD